MVIQVGSAPSEFTILAWGTDLVSAFQIAPKQLHFRRYSGSVNDPKRSFGHSTERR